MIVGIALLLIGPAMFVAFLLLTLPFNIFASWIASKIWLMLVVPLTGWPALSWPAIFGIAAVLRTIHSREFNQKREEDKTDFEREHPWWNALSTAFFLGVIAPLLLYAGAWLVARWTL